MNSTWESFKNELKIIPPLAVGLAIAAFAGMQVVFATLSRVPHKVPPFPAWLFLGLLAGMAAAAWILLIGYINGDAGHRGMGRILWTFIAILVPNCLGILLYFLLRKPFLRQCAGCGAMVDPNFQFCPKCGFAMSPTCIHCGRGIRHEFVCCPYCGKPLRTAAPSSSS
jgi:hypothetical protein